MTFLESDRCERFKSGWHGVMLLLAAGAAAYNCAAAIQRPTDRHLAWNACLYLTLTAIEGAQVKWHWSV